MKIDVHARRFKLAESLRHAVHREIARLAHALGAGITRVSVRLFDVNTDLYRSVPAAFEKVLRSRRMNRARRHTLRRYDPRTQLNPA